ncbi:uncharacterized protein LOC110847538 [Folsomia candida]|uniref:Uncharacterized protein n=1 Tax=Folsomia candida TaxID=158441 RepID=A0A226EGH2_FOLCA|nr:uncharacterized protein LOC110847538 [Folsomia candida]OXA56763.1 hypothetical protein Fcan01_07032 [Folsomia candida]
MNKVILAVVVAVCAITVLEIVTARSHERDHRRQRGNCSTKGDNFLVNVKCGASCWKASNGTQFGGCKDGNCTCYDRGTSNSSTNTTTGRRSLDLYQLPIFETEAVAQRKDKNPLFG